MFDAGFYKRELLFVLGFNHSNMVGTACLNIPRNQSCDFPVAGHFDPLHTRITLYDFLAALQNRCDWHTRHKPRVLQPTI